MSYIIRKQTILLLAFQLVIMSFTACDGTEVELCQKTTHPHLGPVNICFNWDKNDTFGATRPDSMYILSYRIIDAWKCGYVTTTNETNNAGRYVFNNPELEKYNIYIPGNTKTEDGFEETSTDNNENENINNGTPSSSLPPRNEPFNLKRGEYRFIILNYAEDDNVFEYYGLTSETIEEAISEENVLVKYKSYKLNDPLVDKFGNDWTDFNPYSEYVLSNVNSIYFDHTDICEITPDVQNNIMFTPKRVTQDIEIVFTIERQSVMVEKIMGEISGIAQSVNVLTGDVDPSKTYKMLLMMEDNENNGSTSSMNGTNSYTGRFSVIALVRNENEKSISGAGILQLTIYTYTYDDDGNRKNKVLNVGINLFNTINNEYGRIISGRSEKVVLNIDNILTIDKNKILEKTTGNNIDNWIIYKDIDIDL